MPFTTLPRETTSSGKYPFRQYLKGFAGAPVPASEVKVYKNGKLVEIQDCHGKTIRRVNNGTARA